MSTNSYPVFFESALLSDSITTYYNVPSLPTGTQLQDLELKFTNTTAATRTISAYAVPSGDSNGVENAIVYNFSVPAYDYVIAPVTRLSASGVIQAVCDVGGAVNIQAIGGKLHVP